MTFATVAMLLGVMIEAANSVAATQDKAGTLADAKEAISVLFQAPMWSAVSSLRSCPEAAATGAYHQTGEFDIALLDGGSGSGHSSQPSGMAQ
jgi:hypothetical protein